MVSTDLLPLARIHRDMPKSAILTIGEVRSGLRRSPAICWCARAARRKEERELRAC